jgi:arginase family enzyme
LEWNEAEAIRDDRFPDDALYTEPSTFMGTPYSHDLSSAKAAVLGVPFDCGIHPFRIGSRQGPTAIRGQSILVRRYNPELADFDPVERLGLVDRGDVRLTPSRINDASHASKRQRSGFTMPA